MGKVDYDTERAEAPLVTCAVCKQAFYMTHPQAVCVLCRQKAGK